MKKLIPVLFILCAAQSLTAQKISYGNNAAAGKYYAIRGIQLYTETYGTGKPLVLLHGNGGSIASMAAIIPYFAAQYQVIAIDSRAQGKSVDTKDSLSFEMMADDVAAIMDDMKIASADVIGWSDGGIVALDLAMRHPSKIHRLASTGANLWPDSTAFRTGFWQSELRDYNAQKNKPRTTEKEKNDWKLFLLDWLQPNISLTDLHSIKAPSLIICGDHDLISIEHTVQIFQNIATAELWVVPHSGHATLIEHTADFCSVVDRFLKE
ncbi:MAG: alpha/beta hydrolase [Bacteroidetes bacterium]|nr:alpha/beta hydrolase [Bacteroidota bacterium]